MTELPAPSLEAKPASDGKRLRADAQRNREKLIEVAGAAFASNGVDTSLEAIARQADVGIATLYRHFPTREHLVEVVYRREVEGLSAAACDLARDLPPDAALEQWMLRCVDYIAAKRGMGNSLRILVTTNSKVFSDTADLVSNALTQLVAAAVADGSIRADVDVSDILHGLFSTYGTPNSPDWRDRSRRLVSLLMDGLRWGAPKARKS